MILIFLYKKVNAFLTVNLFRWNIQIAIVKIISTLYLYNKDIISVLSKSLI